MLWVARKQITRLLSFYKNLPILKGMFSISMKIGARALFFPYFVFLALAFFPVSPEDPELSKKRKQGRYIDKFDEHSYVDWTEGKVYVRMRRSIYPRAHGKDGQGFHSLRAKSPSLGLSEMRRRARNSLEKEARLKLSSLSYSLRLDSESLIRDRMEQEQSFQTRMGSLASRFQIESRRTSPNYVSIEMSLPFWSSKGLYALLLKSSDRVFSLPRLELESSASYPFMSALIFIVEETETFQSSLYPRFYSREGLLFYSPEAARPRYVLHRGPLVYYSSIERARRDPRAGSNPYIAYVAGLRGARRSDIVVHDKDLEAILGSPSGRRALREAKVIVVAPDRR